MAIPDYQQFMFPLLKYVEDGSLYRLRDIYDQIADILMIPQNERNTLLPSGTQAVYKNRISWAKTHLLKAGLVEAPKRGSFQITQQGKKILTSGYTELTNKSLMQFDGFPDFYYGKSTIPPKIQEASLKQLQPQKKQ